MMIGSEHFKQTLRDQLTARWLQRLTLIFQMYLDVPGR